MSMHPRDCRSYKEWYTYFVTYEDRYLKIGISKSPRNRAFIHSKRPIDLNSSSRRHLLGCVKSSDMPEHEALSRFSYALIDGLYEWFHLTDRVLADLASITFMEPPERIWYRAEMVRRTGMTFEEYDLNGAHLRLKPIIS